MFAFGQRTIEMINCRGSFLASCLLVLSLLAGGESLAPEKKDNCNYTVAVQTTCTKDAGTSNHVSLRFGDANSNDILVRHLNSKHVRKLDPLLPEVLDDMPRKPFQACMVDEFQVTGRCVQSPICYLYLKLSGTDDWQPGFAQITTVEGPHLSSDQFYFRQYMPRNVWHGFDLCAGEVTPFGIKHKRKVFAKKLPKVSSASVYGDLW